MSDHCVVTAIHTYPVKSCRGTSVSSAGISPQGIEGDRQLMILRAGKFTNQARLPRLATVATRRIDENSIEIKADGRAMTHVVDAGGTESAVDFYGNTVAVVDQGDALAELISSTLGTEVRVAALKETFRRAVPSEEFAIIDGINQSQFVDVAPILVTNVGSLEDLNGRLENQVPMNRFRPNIVVEGMSAFEEDTIATLEGDGWGLVRATHCERCAVTCTDQETGERTTEPLATLKSYRHRENGYAGGVMFGAYMGVTGQGVIRVGDRLRVTN
jgi:uncharacterized protein YcbX